MSKKLQETLEGSDELGDLLMRWNGRSAALLGTPSASLEILKEPVEWHRSVIVARTRPPICFRGPTL